MPSPRLSPLNAPTCLNIHTFWMQSQMNHASKTNERVATTHKIAKLDGPQPFKPSYKKVVPSVQPATGASRSKELALAAAAGRIPGYDPPGTMLTQAILDRLGPPPTTTVLLGPRSPRRLVPVVSPRGVAPLSARAATAVPHYTDIDHAKEFPSGGMIIRQHTAQLSPREKPAASDAEVAAAHQTLKQLMETRFKQVRRCFRLIDEDKSGYCSRAELKYMLNAMFNLHISSAVLDKLIDLIDFNADDHISFAEFCRVFTSDDIHNMKKTLNASGKINVDEMEFDEEYMGPLAPQMRDEIMKRYANLELGFKMMDKDK